MADDSRRRPRYRRASEPPGMRFQKRDGALLAALYAYDGVLARRHLKDMFWPDRTWRAMEMRLSLLYHNAFLDWPSRQQRQTQAIPEPVCWLGWRGALWVAGREGVAVEPPGRANESGLRALQRQLRRAGFRWLREPRWVQLAHDLAGVDFRLAVERGAASLPLLSLKRWISEGAFRSQTDVIDVALQGKRAGTKRVRKGVRPDGYFELVNEARLARGELATARFLVEIDNATHDNPSWGGGEGLARSGLHP